jgi:hypothetical protein
MVLLRALLVTAALLGAALVVDVRAQSQAGGADWMNQWVASGGSMSDLMNLVKETGGGAPRTVPGTPASAPVQPPTNGGVGGGGVAVGEPHHWQWHHFNGDNGNDDVTLRPARILLGSSNEMIFFPGTCTPNVCARACAAALSPTAALLLPEAVQL